MWQIREKYRFENEINIGKKGIALKVPQKHEDYDIQILIAVAEKLMVGIYIFWCHVHTPQWRVMRIA
jgi:hypothetical protein